MGYKRYFMYVGRNLNMDIYVEIYFSIYFKGKIEKRIKCGIVI